MREPNDDEPFSALAFKIMTDPYVGKLTYMRVYSGRLDAGSYVYNPTAGKRERISRILLMHSNKREEREAVSTGEIIAAVGLKNVKTGFFSLKGLPSHSFVCAMLQNNRLKKSVIITFFI